MTARPTTPLVVLAVHLTLQAAHCHGFTNPARVHDKAQRLYRTPVRPDIRDPNGHYIIGENGTA